MKEILLTLLTGLFFLLGIILNKFCKNKEKINVLAVSFAFMILLNLLIADLLPEVIENFSFNSLICVILGLAIVRIFDLLVPHHHHHHKEKNDNLKEHKSHLEHIGIITILALTIHNIIECMALYNVAVNNYQNGIMMALAIALHNIPLGFQIGSSMQKNKANYIIPLVFSGFIGGLLSYNIGSFSEIWENYILCFTLGMLLYLTVFELLKEVIQNRKNVNSFYGLLIGIIIIVISKFI